MMTSPITPSIPPSPSNISISITPVTTPEDLADITSLFTAYTASLNIDLTFQDVATELSTLPGNYAPAQRGALLLARTPSGNPVGCIALRRLALALAPSEPPSNDVAELKRLYVCPEARGSGLGRRLAEMMVARAEALGFREVRLDTLPSMLAAQAMYTDLGFVDIEPYCFNPIEGTRYLGLKLSRER